MAAWQLKLQEVKNAGGLSQEEMNEAEVQILRSYQSLKERNFFLRGTVEDATERVKRLVRCRKACMHPNPSLIGRVEQLLLIWVCHSCSREIEQCTLPTALPTALGHMPCVMCPNATNYTASCPESVSHQ